MVRSYALVLDLDQGFRQMEHRVLVRFVLRNLCHMLRNLLHFAIDIDECAEGLHNCSSINNTMCVNVNGSFDCPCISGYQEDNSTGECIG